MDERNPMNLEPGQVVVMGLHPTLLERQLREPRRSETFDVIGDGLRVVYENRWDPHSDVLVIDTGGRAIFRASPELWACLQPLVDRAEGAATIRDALHELASVPPPMFLEAVEAKPANRHERRAAAALAKRKAQRKARKR
jgi:hypothetical protein